MDCKLVDTGVRPSAPSAHENFDSRVVKSGSMDDFDPSFEHSAAGSRDSVSRQRVVSLRLGEMLDLGYSRLTILASTMGRKWKTSEPDMYHMKERTTILYI